MDLRTKKTLPKFEQPQDYQQKVEEEKKAYLALDLSERVRSYHFVRSKVRQLEDEVSLFNIQKEALSQLIVEELESRQIDKIRTDQGYIAYISSEVYPSVEEKDAFYAFVNKTRQLKALLTMHHQTLKGLVKSMLERGEKPYPGVRAFLKTSARVRGNGDAEE